MNIFGLKITTTKHYNELVSAHRLQAKAAEYATGRAKQEIHGHATGVAMSVGIEKLREDGAEQVLLPPCVNS